jgi:hypothetical protein
MSTPLPDELVSWLRWLAERAGQSPDEAWLVPNWDGLIEGLDGLATGLARTLHPLRLATGAPQPLPEGVTELLGLGFWHVAQLRELLAIFLAQRPADVTPQRSALLYGLVLGASSTLVAIQDHLVSRGYQ